MGSLSGLGGPADTPGFGDYPFTFESKLRLEHPEWVPVDKHGARRQGGPIELAYPDARKALVDLIVGETIKVGYDGISFLTYVENYSLRFADEFGYSDPIVNDFKAQYKVDSPHRAIPAGSLARGLAALARQLCHHVSSGIEGGVRQASSEDRNGGELQRSPSTPIVERSGTVVTAGSQFMDVNTWVREGLVDELLIYGNNSPQSQYKTLDDLLSLARGTKTEVSVITSGPFREAWKPYIDKGIPTILAVSDDAQHLERGFVPEQTAEALKSQDLSLRWRALQQCVAGTLKLDDASLAICARSPNLIERRLALQAIGKSPSADLKILLAGLRDPENGVRCVAALALADRKDPAYVRGIAHGCREEGQSHDARMYRHCPAPPDSLPVDLLKRGRLAFFQSGDPRSRDAGPNPHANAKLIPTFREGLKDKTRFPRFAAAEALGNVTRSPEAIELLKNALDHDDVAVANRARGVARKTRHRPRCRHGIP